MDQKNVQSAIEKLNQITQKLSKFPSKPDELLKEYVSIYVQTHHLSDDLFVTICENKYLMILLQNSPKVQQSTCVLQCLNLLITNTKNSNQLTYFLAQKPLHQFLFPANLLQKESQFIQYYIQLLKTILMKISDREQNRQLIHMFCNQKYTSFPLFTNVTLLACFKNQMIQVTARQCILIIVKMIKNGRGYQVYLGQPAMIILVVRLSTQFLRPGSDEQGISKFFADLLYELKNNKIPLIMVSNIICNVIIVCNIPHRFEVALKFVDMLGKTIETKICQQIENGHKMGKQEQQNEQSEQKGSKKENEKYGDLLIICATFFQVIAKYLTKQYIHPIYFLAHIKFSLPSSANLQKQEQQKQRTLCLPLSLVCPQTQELCKILNTYSLKKYVDEGNSVSEMELGRDCMEDFIEKGKSLIKSKQFTKILQSHLKQVPKQTNFFDKMFNRQNSQQSNIKYLKQISQFSSLILEKGQPVFLNLVKQFLPSTSPFVIEFYNLSSLLQDCKKALDEKELVFNRFFNSWSFNSTNLDIVHQLCKRLSQFPDSKRRPQLLLPKLSVTPFMFFLQNFQSYLENQIHNHINRSPKNKQLVQSMPNIITFAKICSSLNLVVSQISTKYLTKQLLNLHSQMQNSLFENGFSGVFQFIKLKRKIYELEIETKKKMDENHIKKHRQNGMKIIKVKSSITFLKICAFDCIYKIMEPKAKSVDKYFETKWKSTFDQQKNHQLTHNQQIIDQFKVQFQNTKDCDLLFTKIMKPPSVVIRVNLNGEKLLQADLMQSQLCSDPISCCFYLSELKQHQLKACSSQRIGKIRERWEKIKQDFTANITNATLQYISITNDSLNEIDRKSMQLQSDFFIFPI